MSIRNMVLVCGNEEHASSVADRVANLNEGYTRHIQPNASMILGEMPEYEGKDTGTLLTEALFLHSNIAMAKQMIPEDEVIVMHTSIYDPNFYRDIRPIAKSAVNKLLSPMFSTVNIYMVYVLDEVTDDHVNSSKYGYATSTSSVKVLDEYIRANFGLDVVKRTMLYSEVKRHFLANKFQEKPQPGGVTDLHEYVYKAAAAILAEHDVELIDDIGYYTKDNCDVVENTSTYRDHIVDPTCDEDDSKQNNFEEST